MLFILFISTLSMISSTQWFMVWVFLEMNTLSMCYLFSKDLNNGKMKFIFILIYYSIQVFSSLLILISVMKLEFLLNQGESLLFLSGVLMKMGVWPFHSWYLKMIDSLEMNFSSLWMMMTWQKLMPLFIILFSMKMQTNYILFIFFLLNLLLSLVFLKKVFNVKSVLGFSSMNSNSWLLILIFFSMFIWKMFLLAYSFSMILIMYFTNQDKSKDLNYSIILLILIFNMSGFPPFLMFWVKVLTIKSMLINKIQGEIIFLLLMSTCYIIFFYLYMILLEFLHTSLKS